MAKKKYYKFDSEKGYLENLNEINYFANNQMRRVAVGNMLGDFDENGLYVLDKKIVKELISIPKVVVDSIETADLLRSVHKFDNFLHFMLTIQDNKASLILLEKINFESNVGYNAGSYSNMNEYTLAELVVPDRDVDKNIIYTKWNIIRADDSRVFDLKSLTEEELALIFNITNKMKRNIAVQDTLLQNEAKIESIEADYFESMLGAIRTNEALYKNVMNNFASKLDEKQTFLMIDHPFFQKTVNELFDNVADAEVERMNGKEKIDMLNKFADIKQEYCEKFAKVLPYEVVKSDEVSTGVSNDDNMISSLAKSLVDEAETKEVRTPKVDENIYHRSLVEMLVENKELKDERIKNNSGRLEITHNRKNATEFYNQYDKSRNTHILGAEIPEEKIIAEEIKENLSSTENLIKARAKTKDVNASKSKPKNITKIEDKEMSEERTSLER